MRRAARAPRVCCEGVDQPIQLREGPVDENGALARCARCGLHVRLCICAHIQPLELRTRVIVLRHRREVHKPSNSGRLVPLVLTGGEVRVVGGGRVPLEAQGLIEPERRSLLLYPSADSTPLARDDADDRPITLIVPDANWRGAHKMTTREPALAGIPRVHVPGGARSNYRLRRHPDPRFLATFEAIARALGILEGPAVQAHMEHVFKLMVERTLYSRGQLGGDRVTGGVPALGPKPT